MIQSIQPLDRCVSLLARPCTRHRPRVLTLTGTALLALVLGGGCADPLMRRSQLPDTIDYSGGDTHQAPALPTQPATAPTAEILKPASLPTTPTTVPASLPVEGSPMPPTQPAGVEPATTRPGL